MWRAITSAWVALRRPAVLLSTLGSIAAFSILSTTIRFTTATESASTQATAGPAPKAVTIATLAHADGFVSGLRDATTFLGIVAVALGAFVFASDYQTGIIRVMLVRQPRRLVVVGGKLVALSALLAAAAVLATVISGITGFALAGGQGVDTSAWEPVQALGAAGRTAVVLVGFGLLGSALGLVLRSSVAAVGIGVGWVFAVETILKGAVDGADDVLPGQLLARVADHTAGGAQTLLLVGYAAVAAAICGRLVLRRDVTA